MDLKEFIYLSSLIDGIDKIIKIGNFDDVTKNYKGSFYYLNISVNLIEKLAEENMFFKDYLEKLVEINSTSNDLKGHISQIIKVSEELSSIEFKVENENKRENISPLNSVFNNLYKKSNENNKYFYKLLPLKLEGIFPVTNYKIDPEEYSKLVSLLFSELKKVNNESQLFHVLLKYLWSIPVHSNSDVSLFDYSKTKSAISLCLYEQYEKGQLNKGDLEQKLNSEKEQFILINGDISGIQDFIFSIPSKGAAKSLKGRSVYISLVSDIVVRYILDRLSLKEVNLLYNGGGNFYILAPKCKKELFYRARKEILEKILIAHDGDIYFAMDCIELSPLNFTNFTEKWDELKYKVNKLKDKKWSEISLNDNMSKIFGPFDEGTKEGNHCSICSVVDSKRRLVYDTEKEYYFCELCDSFIKLTDKLKKAKYLILKRTPIKNFNGEINSFNEVFGLFGYNIDFTYTLPKNMDKYECYCINDTNFININCTGFKFGAYSLPIEDGEQLDFTQLANKSKGDKKLGVLKLDVDNLGSIFSKGFINNRTITRISSLSRMLSLYFTGYINYLIRSKGWSKELYVVYSGGDDTFVVGSWNSLFEFTKQFYDDFRRYTCYNEKVTFSAGLSVVSCKYPVNRAAELAEDALDNAKNFRNKDQLMPMKNKVSLFGEVFNWHEFERIIKIKEILVKLIKDLGYGHALLYKVEKSTLGFKNILNDSNKGKVNNIRFWRLAYYLRQVKNDDIKNNTNYAEKIIDEYRRIVINNLMEKNENKKIKNIMIIPAAIKWAELETRDVKESEL